jgi:hypothetical protein
MKRSLVLLLISVLFLFQCEKDESENSYFSKTSHPISSFGDSMKLVIQLPDYTSYYNFSADSNSLNSLGVNFYDILVPKKEMVCLAENLSDTLVFRWADMTAQSPYPSKECVLLVYGGYSQIENSYYMCSIGEGKSAATIIQELGKSFTGNPHNVFDSIYNQLLD